MKSISILIAALIAVTLPGALAMAKKPVKSTSKKVIYAKSLSATLSKNPKAPPGKSKLPFGESSLSSSSPAASSDFTIKMRPAKAAAAIPAAVPSPVRAIARKLPAKQLRSVAATKPVNPNEPISTFLRSIQSRYKTSSPSLGSSAALAVNGSYLVTSADFVAESWTNSGDVKFYLSDVGQPLTLVGFDLPMNVAIFTTGLNTQMDKSLPLQRLRVDLPTATEELASLGVNGIVGGVRRAFAVADFSTLRERFELPASVVTLSAVGTQFLFDKSGRWVGAASLLDQRDGRKFDVTTSSQIHDMIRQLELRPPAALPLGVLQTQVASWQERWSNMFFEAAKKGFALRNLNCAAESLRVDDQKIANELVRTRLVHCQNMSPVSITHDYNLGFEIMSGDVSYTNDVATFISKDVSSATIFASKFFGNGERAVASVNVLTTPECDRSDVANGRGHHFHVRFCTSALKNAPGFNDSTITVISSDTGLRSSVNSVHLRGFDPVNAKKFMEWLIETEAVR